MSYWDVYEAEWSMHRNVQDRLEEADRRTLLREPGTTRHPLWVRLARGTAGRLGRALVALGTRLEVADPCARERAQPRPKPV